MQSSLSILPATHPQCLCSLLPKSTVTILILAIPSVSPTNTCANVSVPLCVGTIKPLLSIVMARVGGSHGSCCAKLLIFDLPLLKILRVNTIFDNICVQIDSTTKRTDIGVRWESQKLSKFNQQRIPVVALAMWALLTATCVVYAIPETRSIVGAFGIREALVCLVAVFVFAAGLITGSRFFK